MRARRVPREVTDGDGWSVSSVERLVPGRGVLDLREALDVSAFSMTALVLPPGASSAPHCFREREAVYLVHRGRVCLELAGTDWFVLEAGGLARVDAGSIRCLRNVGDDEAIVLSLGGRGGSAPGDEAIVCGDLHAAA